MTQQESLIGRAWAYHRDGRNDAALTEFEQVVRQDPNNVDAVYGLGLVQRSLGRTERAFQSFEKAQELVQMKIAETPGQDRWEMLTRLINQRLEELRTAK